MTRLTDERIDACAEAAGIKCDLRFGLCSTGNVQLRSFARAIESELARQAELVAWCSCEPNRCDGVGKCRWHAMSYTPEAPAQRALYDEPFDLSSPDSAPDTVRAQQLAFDLINKWLGLGVDGAEYVKRELARLAEKDTP